jgi:hypothetical protein
MTLSRDAIIDAIEDLIPDETPDEGVGGILLEVAHNFGFAAAIFVPDEIGHVQIKRVEEAMIAAGNEVIG